MALLIAGMLIGIVIGLLISLNDDASYQYGVIDGRLQALQREKLSAARRDRMIEEDYEKDERGLPLQFYPDDPPIEKGVWMKLEIHVTPEEFDLLKQAQLEAARWEDVGLWLSEVQMILNRKLSPFTNYEIVVNKLQTRKIAAERGEEGEDPE